MDTGLSYPEVIEIPPTRTVAFKPAPDFKASL